MEARLQKHSSVYHKWLSRGSLEQKGAGPFLQKPRLGCLTSGPDSCSFTHSLWTGGFWFAGDGWFLLMGSSPKACMKLQLVMWNACGGWMFFFQWCVSASQYPILQSLPDNVSSVLWILILPPLLHPSNVHSCALRVLCPGAASINTQGEFKSIYICKGLCQKETFLKEKVYIQE